jgi:hypothetical protein
MVAVGIVVLMLYYGFLFDFALSAKNSIVGVMEDKGITKITIPMKEYRNGTWVDTTKELDLVGVVDILMTVVLVLGPVAIITRWFL